MGAVNSAFGHSEWVSSNYPVVAIAPNTLTAASTVNTYSVSPQPAAGIDTWDSGALLPTGVVILINVASVSTTGTLTVTLRDSASAITTANGDATTYLVATLATISAAGLYYAELKFSHVFATGITRTTASADNATVRRYQSFRAVAASADFVFGAIAIYTGNQKNFPVQDATALDVTWVAA